MGDRGALSTADPDRPNCEPPRLLLTSWVAVRADRLHGSVMKPGIHPDYKEVNVHCACGATWTTRSTKGQELRLEICSSCHPFFTGKQKLMDTEGRVERFNKKFGAQTSESRKKAAKAKKDAPAAAR